MIEPFALSIRCLERAHERTFMLALLQHTSRRKCLSVSMALTVFVSGCGYADYELRLTESKNYYAYLDKVEQSMAPKWVAAGNLMDLRVPKQFLMIPPPPPPPKDEENPEPPIDQRQPDYVNLTFPGMFGAWEASFKGTSNGKGGELKGYIYALSNYWEFAGKNATDAGNFTAQLKELMAEKLHAAEPETKPESYPKAAKSYRPQITYDVSSFKNVEIDGTNYSFDVYSRTLGSIIGVIVVVLPEGSDPKVLERIPMMLETFNFTRVPPKAGAEKNAPAPQNQNAPAF